jgi:hypothetical protein
VVDREDNKNMSPIYPESAGFHIRPRRLTQDEAVDALIQGRKITPPIVSALGLKPHAVAMFHDLPSEAQESMIDIIIDKFCD